MVPYLASVNFIFLPGFVIRIKAFNLYEPLFRLLLLYNLPLSVHFTSVHPFNGDEVLSGDAGFFNTWKHRLLLLDRNVLNKVNKSIFLRVTKANNTNLNIVTFKNTPLVPIHIGYGYFCA